MFTRVWSLVRSAIGVVALGIVASGCGGPTEIKTVSDFDEAPCLLFAEDAMRQIVAEPFRDLLGSDPKTTQEPEEASGGDSHACVYRLGPTQASRVPPVNTLTVTIEHNAGGSQPLAICVAGAGTNSPGYKLQQIADQACLSPTSDLWMRIGENFYHVVLVPQPGFDNPVDMNLALSPMILAVGTAVAGRMPKS